MKDFVRIHYAQTKGSMMKKFALFYGIISTLLWLIVLIFLMIDFKDLTKDSHKTIKECIDKHNTYPKELLQLGKEENLEVSFILQADTCEIHSLTLNKPKSEFTPHITRVLHKAKACIKMQCQTHNTPFHFSIAYHTNAKPPL